MPGNETHGPAAPGRGGGQGALTTLPEDVERSVAEREDDAAARDWDNEGGHERGHVGENAHARGRDPEQPPDPDALRLTGVLATALPPELGTAREPVAYTVPAVFSRRVTREEQDAIESDDVRRRLAGAGYEGVELTVSDRRLLIGHTSLAALRSGLAREIAGVLRDVSRDLVAEHDRLAAEVADLQREEDRRAGAVLVEADEIRFE